MSTRQLDQRSRRYFRDLLRDARASALTDGEGFHSLIVAIEQLGAFLFPKGLGLSAFEPHLLGIGKQAATYSEANARLFTHVRLARNDAVHSGAFARHLTRHCVELSLLLEEGLLAGSSTVGDFMVKDVVIAEPWQSVASARQRMLANSFSFLPIQHRGAWHVLSDHAVARYLRLSDHRKAALARSIEDACVGYGLKLQSVLVVGPQTSVTECLERTEPDDMRPLLVCDDAQRLLGIATPFDLL